MSIQIVKSSATELVITQQKKLTVTGVFFCVPAVMLLFSLPLLPGFTVFLSCVILWMIVLLCFYRGITYTFKADRLSQQMEFTVKGLLKTTRNKFEYSEIDHFKMAESFRYLKKSADCGYYILVETNQSGRFRFFDFSDRCSCKQTRALMESYIH